VLLACAAFLGVGQILVGAPMRPLPDLAVVGATALLPAVLAARITRVPGAASAVCGVYLLPASLLSLLLPAIPTPPLLLVAALVYDLCLWLEPRHFQAILDLLPRRIVWHRAGAPRGQPSGARAALAGGAFGLALGVVEPPFRVFLGADPAIWLGPGEWLGAAACALSCTVVGTLLTFRGTAA
jgi:hypothetical protein